MNKRLALIFTLLATLQLSAQTAFVTVRLAIISETPEAGVAADVLTTEFSKNENIHLLERAEIDKVYREQGLSAGNTDYLKLGQVLGADGLLLLEVNRSVRETNLLARLIAVKPGVVLANEAVAFPLRDVTGWAPVFANHINPLFPKLTVMAKDAIPISVVNLRSATGSAEAAETERQLKLLAIQRLSREPQLFVLERQKMELLSAEKDLNADSSAFWNGAYLLDGSIDENGVSADVVTIDVRLTPHNGGLPMRFEVSGSRTNFAEVINQLAVKVTGLLQVHSSIPEWKPADEAAKYFDEANWAMRWGVLPEAKSAADSAWALGKQDLDCATVQVRACLAELSATVGKYQGGEFYISTNFNADGKPLGPPPGEKEVQSTVRDIVSEYPFGVTYSIRRDTPKNRVVISYMFASARPNPENIDRATHLLELYYNFSKNHADDLAKKGAMDKASPYSKWKDLGIEVLTAASQVLQNFNFSPESQTPVAAKLGDLRAQTRSLAEFISNIPAVHDSYFVGDRIANRDELVHTIGEPPNIFKCKLEWGCFWQERPEDSLALYRDLMASPVFCYIHMNFWSRSLVEPRLVGWNDEANQQIPGLWKNFVSELDHSTNVLLRMEAKALARSDATDEAGQNKLTADLFEIIRSNRAELVANNVELFYLGWGLAFPNPELDAMDQEYQQKTAAGQGSRSEFQKQKDYLKNNQPFVLNEFAGVFFSQNYDREQAREIQPLIVSYKSNLVAQSQSATGVQKARSIGDISYVGMVENHVNQIINSPVSPPQPPPPPTQPPPAPIAAKAPETARASPASTVEIVTNIIVANKFLAIPVPELENGTIGKTVITSHHWQEGKLVLDLKSSGNANTFDAKGNWVSGRWVIRPFIAILDLATKQWKIIDGPVVDNMGQNPFYDHTTLWRGDVFTSEGGQVKKYDAVRKKWRVLPMPDGGYCELFAVNDRLYAASPNLIMEILDGGRSTHILASNRRQPPASPLDTEDLGLPALFEGPGHSLRVATKNKIFAQDGDGWQEVCTLPPASLPAEITPSCVLFRNINGNLHSRLSRLATNDTSLEFCLGRADQADSSANSKPTWDLPPQLSLAHLPAASRGRDIYLMADHSASEDIVNQQQHLIIGKKILPRDGYHAALFCFSENFPGPQKIYLRFDPSNPSAPVTGTPQRQNPFLPGRPPAWLQFSAGYLVCGLENFDAVLGGEDPANNTVEVGVWLIPTDKMDASVAAQKKSQREQQARLEALAKQSRQALLEKCDLNHNGIIDDDEREPALADTNYITSKLDEIHTNKNGWLGANELAYFDANTNKLLEPVEQAGIEIAQHLLAQRLLTKYDVNGDGALDRWEFQQLLNGLTDPADQWKINSQNADENHDGKIDVDELYDLCQKQTERELRQPRMGEPLVLNQMTMDGTQAADPGQYFKKLVEHYWQRPHRMPNRPLFFNEMPPGMVFGPGGMRHDMPP